MIVSEWIKFECLLTYDNEPAETFNKNVLSSLTLNIEILLATQIETFYTQRYLNKGRFDFTVKITDRPLNTHEIDINQLLCKNKIEIKYTTKIVYLYFCRIKMI